MKKLLALSLFSFPLLAFGQAAAPTSSVGVGSGVVGSMDGVPTDLSFLGSFGFQVSLLVGCYGGDLRYADNPLAPGSTVTMQLNLQNRSPVVVSFPANWVFANNLGGGGCVDVGGWCQAGHSGYQPYRGFSASDLAAAQNDAGNLNAATATAMNTIPIVIGAPSNSMGAVYGPVLQMLLPAIAPFSLTNAQGVVDQTALGQVIQGLTFFQAVGNNASSGPHVGASGVMGVTVAAQDPSGQPNYNPDIYGAWASSVVVSQKVNPAGNNVSITAAFAGQNFACGGYYSPLMLFFDKERPKFSGTAEFHLNDALKGKTSWPEAHSPGYFLAYDRNGDGKINDGTELFGDGMGYSGFETLRKLFGKKGGKITAKDPLFKKLLLWRDENGDGVSQPSELKTLADLKVVSISLDDNSAELQKIGSNAEIRQRAKFEFTGKDGKIHTGEIADVYFVKR